MVEIISGTTEFKPIPPVNEGPAFTTSEGFNGEKFSVPPAVSNSDRSVPDVKDTYGIRAKTGVSEAPAVPNSNLMPEPVHSSIWNRILRRKPH